MYHHPKTYCLLFSANDKTIYYEKKFDIIMIKTFWNRYSSWFKYWANIVFCYILKIQLILGLRLNRLFFFFFFLSNTNIFYFHYYVVSGICFVIHHEEIVTFQYVVFNIRFASSLLYFVINFSLLEHLLWTSVVIKHADKMNHFFFKSGVV